MAQYLESKGTGLYKYLSDRCGNGIAGPQHITCLQPLANLPNRNPLAAIG